MVVAARVWPCHMLGPSVTTNGHTQCQCPYNALDTKTFTFLKYFHQCKYFLLINSYPVWVLMWFRMRLPLEPDLARLTVHGLSQVLDWQRSGGHIAGGRPTGHAAGHGLDHHLVSFAGWQVLRELCHQRRSSLHGQRILPSYINCHLVPAVYIDFNVRN